MVRWRSTRSTSTVGSVVETQGRDGSAASTLLAACASQIRTALDDPLALEQARRIAGAQKGTRPVDLLAVDADLPEVAARMSWRARHPSACSFAAHGRCVPFVRSGRVSRWTDVGPVVGQLRAPSNRRYRRASLSPCAGARPNPRSARSCPQHDEGAAQGTVRGVGRRDPRTQPGPTVGSLRPLRTCRGRHHGYEGHGLRPLAPFHAADTTL